MNDVRSRAWSVQVYVGGGGRGNRDDDDEEVVEEREESGKECRCP